MAADALSSVFTGSKQAGREPAWVSREPAKAGRAVEAEGHQGPQRHSHCLFNWFKANLGESNVFQKVMFGKV